MVGNIIAIIGNADWKRNVQYRTGKKHICKRVNTLDGSPRWEPLLKGWTSVPIQQAEQPSIVLEICIVQTREAIGVNVVVVRFILLLVPWVIHEKSFQSRRTTDDDTVHCVSVMFRMFLIPILNVMKVTDREKGDPCALIVADTMNK